MGNWTGGPMMVAIAVALGWLSLVVMGRPRLHKVGGSRGWINHGVNYSQWSAQEHVYVGDWLLFMFDKRYFNVLEVNKTSYERCIDKEFITNVTRGGRDVVQLTEARSYYYLSGGGYCFGGMKVGVHVEEYQDSDAPAAAPAPSQIASASLLPSLRTCVWIIGANVLYVNLLLMDFL